MPREKENFRETLERLNQRYPGREAITVPEAATLLGRCPRTLHADKQLPKCRIGREYVVPIVGLARWLS